MWRILILFLLLNTSCAIPIRLISSSENPEKVRKQRAYQEKCRDEIRKYQEKKEKEARAYQEQKEKKAKIRARHKAKIERKIQIKAKTKAEAEAEAEAKAKAKIEAEKKPTEYEIMMKVFNRDNQLIIRAFEKEGWNPFQISRDFNLYKSQDNTPTFDEFGEWIKVNLFFATREEVVQDFLDIVKRNYNLLKEMEKCAE